jgi:hypothetical protein
MANVFNSMSRRVIFSKSSCISENIIQLVPFVPAFYAFEYLLFYSNHYNREGNMMIILFAMGIHQADPLGRVLFTLVHFRALHFIINCFHYRLVPSIVDDTNIIGAPLIVPSTYEHFQTEQVM